MKYSNLLPGDIVLSYGAKRTLKSVFTNLLQWIIRIFTTTPFVEPLTRVHHAEMIFGPKETEPGEWMVITEEPPGVHLMDLGSSPRRIIFRLNKKPEDFESKFYEYCKASIGKPYDYIKFLVLGLDWLFCTTFFSRNITNSNADICSEFVARFYDRYIGIPCSTQKAGSTTPDDIYDYCKAHQDLFTIVYDGW